MEKQAQKACFFISFMQQIKNHCALNTFRENHLR